MTDQKFDKKEFIECLYNAYITKFVNTNIHCHLEFLKILKQACALKKQADILRQYERIKNILLHNDFVIPDIPQDVVYNQEDIYYISSAVIEEFPLLAHVKDIVSPGVYAMLNYIYSNVLHRSNLGNVIIAIKYILDVKIKGSDIIDVVCNLLTYLAKRYNKDVQKYILISRELLYFQSNRKKLRDRVKLIYIMVYVLITGNIDYTKLEHFDGDVKFKYLYVICEKRDETDPQLEEKLYFSRLRKPQLKNVKIERFLQHESDIDVVKI